MFRPFVMTLLMLVLAPMCLAENFVEGTDYLKLEQPVRARNPAKIEVVEVFWYGCPHCFRFDPMVKAWKKGLSADVDFWYSPVIWNDLTQFHAQGFYAAQALGIAERIHEPFFTAINVQGNMLNTPDKLFGLFATQGVTRDQFDKTFASFGVTSQVNQAKSRVLSYRIEGTPELVVNGKYRVGGNTAGKSLPEAEAHKRMLQIVDFLIEKERKAKASTK